MNDTFFTFDSIGFSSKATSLDPFSDFSYPDLLSFELEVDSSVALFDEDLQAQLLSVDSPETYHFLRTQPPRCGPPSTITSSAESTSYDNRSEALFSTPTNYTPSNYSFNLDFDGLDLNTISVESDFGVAPVGINLTPPAQTIDPAITMGFDSPLGSSSPMLDDMLGQPTFNRHRHSPSYSDYSGMAPSKRPDYLNPTDMLDLERSMNSLVAQNMVKPTEASLSPEPEDPRKKHKCNACNRAFARAFNLKTHMATHDPKREKPHVCHHFPCDKSFSRKHDLGRHLVSIHNDTSLCPTRGANGKKPSANKSTVGVARGTRGWCELCGKGWVGKQIDCDCKEEELLR